MPDYDFHQLSPSDFEILARDLLQAEWKVTIENFKSGKDGGIDLRFANGPNETIVQAKHFIRTGFNGLAREMRKEAEKVNNLNPSRYVLITSIPLSYANKEKLVGIVGKEFLKPEDVHGQESLNNLLGLHPNIESDHYKLWLASKAVLDQTLHNAATNRSRFKVEEVYKEARRYVAGKAYPKALSMLCKEQVVIISGPPGIGKTTMANLLLFEHLAKGYQAVVMQGDIREGEDLFQPDTQQIFYFDDFMGATFLGDPAAAQIGSKDKSLLNFISMVRATQSSRIILTTREHIYSQAKTRSERLRHSDLDDARVVLDLKSYSQIERAKILYNHLYFSDLPSEYQDEILRDQFFLKIVKHNKFNPRIIKWLSTFNQLKNTPVAQYQEFIDDLLQNPSEIWRHAYEQDITDATRSLLLSLFSLGGKAQGKPLESAFSKLHQVRSNRYGFKTRPEDFQFSLREAAGAFIKPFGQQGFEVIDPSVLDLLNAVVLSAPDNVTDILTGAVEFDQIQHIWMFAKSKNGQPVKLVIQRDANVIALNVHDCMLASRYIDYGDGLIGLTGVTFEERLRVTLDIALRTRSPAYASLIAPLFAQLEKKWNADEVNITDAIALLRTFESNDLASLAEEVGAIKNLTQAALINEVSSGCSLEELEEFICVVCVTDAHSPATMAANSAFHTFRTSYFADELRECGSADHFQDLINSLLFVGKQLRVDVTNMVIAAEDANEEFDESQSEYDDASLGGWKEQMYEERDANRSVVELFDSLKTDRN